MLVNLSWFVWFISIELRLLKVVWCLVMVSLMMLNVDWLIGKVRYC